MSGPWGEPHGRSSVPGAAGATYRASVSGPRHSHRDTRTATQENSTHTPERFGEITFPAGVNGKS
jgi:hypothetical protein